MTRWLALAGALIAVVLAQVEPSAEAVGQRFYVKAGATGANDGSSWEDAFKSLQTALFQATAGDEIWVASGVYKPTPFAGRAVSFVLPDSVSVYGSFDGDETSVAQRDFGLTPTSTLSGAIGTVSEEDNSYHVVTLPGGIDGKLDGFQIVDGRADGGGADDLGGGVVIEPGLNSYEFKNLRIKHNWADVAGGAVYAEGSLNLYDSWVTENEAGVRAAGIELTDGFSEIYSATFNKQVAPNDAVMRLSGDARLTATNVFITGNDANDDTGIRVMGTAQLSFVNSTIYLNFASDPSPGFLQIGATATLDLHNTIVWDNPGDDVDPTAGASIAARYSIIPGGCPAGAVCQFVYDVDPGILNGLRTLGSGVIALALLPTSPAIDAGTPAQCPQRDARNAIRPFDGNGDAAAMCDIGALEYTPPPSLDFEAAAIQSPEGTALFIDVLVSHKYPLPVDATIEVSGTAELGDDFVLNDAHVDIPADHPKFVATVNTTNDLSDEPNETIVLTLTSPSNATLGDIPAVTITEVDNDAPPTISFAQATSGKFESAAPEVRVEISQPSGYNVGGRLALSGSATGGVDYVLAGLSFSIEPGETETVLPLSVVNDYLDEPDETIVLKIDKAAFSTKTAPATHTYTIKDNDPARSCLGRKVTIIGTPGNDTLIGTPGIDVIEGLNGKDVIRGLGGNDRLCGGPGADIVRGGPGADSLFGAAANDRLFGQGGNDLIKGGGGKDTLRGELGRDRLSGGAGKGDICDGGANTDSLLAGHRCEVVTAVP